MKKFLGLFVLATLLADPVQADCGCGQSKCNQAIMEKGGFVDDSMKITSVEEAKKLPDEALVMLEGNIVKQIKEDEYEFSDGKNMVVIEIDEDDWNGVKVTPKNKIIIKGEVDKDLTSYKIEVDSVKKVH